MRLEKWVDVLSGWIVPPTYVDGTEVISGNICLCDPIMPMASSLLVRCQ